jgi:hypothetical protein
MAAGVLLFSLASCTGQASPVRSAGPASGGASPTSLSPEQVSDIERQFVQDEIADGHDPAGDPVVTYLHGQLVYLIWPTTDQGLCTGEYLAGGSERGCFTNWHLPTGTTPRLEAVWGPGSASPGWMTVFLADHEDVRSLTCGGVRTEVRKVGEIRTPETDLAVYTYVVPWWPDGTAQAEVVRDDGPATEQVSFEVLGGQRYWKRECDSRPIAHP